MFVSSTKKHVSIHGMSRMPWKRRPASLPKPRFQSNWRSVSFMRAMYSICLPVTGCTTPFAKCCWDQWFVPKATAMFAVSMFQKSFCDKFLGERFCESVGTLGGAARPGIGVITLGSNGVLVAHSVLIVVCDLVWYVCCMGEVRMGCAIMAGLLFSAAFIGAFESSGVFEVYFWKSPLVAWALLLCHPRLLRMGRWRPWSIWPWMTIVALMNCEEKTPKCPRCVCLRWRKYTRVDIYSDALLIPKSSHFGHGVPKCAALQVFHELWFCILAEQKLFCCNQWVHDSELQQIIMGVVWTSEGDLMSFLLAAKVCPTDVKENMGQLMPILPQSVLWKYELPFQRHCGDGNGVEQVGIPRRELWKSFLMPRMPCCPGFEVWVWNPWKWAIDEWDHMPWPIQRRTLTSWVQLWPNFSQKHNRPWHTSCLCWTWLEIFPLNPCLVVLGRAGLHKQGVFLCPNLQAWRSHLLCQKYWCFWSWTYILAPLIRMAHGGERCLLQMCIDCLFSEPRPSYEMAVFDRL
jgi:hypothetical protein